MPPATETALVAEPERRFRAFAVDRAIAWTLFAAAAVAAWWWFFRDDRPWVGVGIVAGAVVVVSLVFAVLLGTKGTSPGKSMMGLRVVSSEGGGPIGLGRALLRTVVVGIGSLPMFGLGLATLAWTAVEDRTRERRGWHDHVARSVVIDVRPRPVAEVEADERPKHVVNLTAMKLMPVRQPVAPVVPAPEPAPAAGSAAAPAGKPIGEPLSPPSGFETPESRRRRIDAPWGNEPKGGQTPPPTPPEPSPPASRPDPARAESRPDAPVGHGQATTGPQHQPASQQPAPQQPAPQQQGAPQQPAPQQQSAPQQPTPQAQPAAPQERTQDRPQAGPPADRPAQRPDGPGALQGPGSQQAGSQQAGPQQGAPSGQQQSGPPAPATTGRHAGPPSGPPATGQPGVAAPGQRAARPRVSMTWRVTFDTGESFVVEGLGIVGRQPSARPGEPVRHVVPLRSDDMSISKTHAQFHLAGDGALVVTDRGSTNGSLLVRRGVSRELTAGRPATVVDGDRVVFGDRQMTVTREA